MMEKYMHTLPYSKIQFVHLTNGTERLITSSFMTESPTYGGRDETD